MTAPYFPAHVKLFPLFYGMMLEEMNRNYDEKGDSWLTSEFINVDRRDFFTNKIVYTDKVPTLQRLIENLEDAFHDFMENKNLKHLLDIANYCAMITMRKRLKTPNICLSEKVNT